MERNPNTQRRAPNLGEPYWAPHDPESDWYAPIPPRKRHWLGWVLAALLGIMLIWEMNQIPPLYEGRFMLRIDDETAYAYGTTDSYSYPEVEEVLNANPQLETLILAHVPGTKDMAQNVEIARLIRDRGLDTHLTETSYIASGGVHLFLAGEERTMECGAKIGVHSWKSADGETPRSLGFDPAEGYMSDFHEEMGVGADFYAFSRDASPHEAVYFLRKGDIEHFDLLTEESCEETGWW